MAAKICRILAGYSSVAISGRFRRAPKKAFIIGDFVTRTGIRHPGLQVQAHRMMASTGIDSAVSSDQIPGIKSDLELKDEAPVNDSGGTSEVPVAEAKSDSGPKAEEEPPTPTDQATSGASNSVEGPAPSATQVPEEEKKQFRRIPKIKVALLLSYSGQGYFGLQLQKDGTKTIENDLLQALFDGGVIDEEGFTKPKTIKFQRAARTDKNVSAARNIISVMVPKTFDVDDVNKHLPNQIRVMDFRRVTKGFDSKIACNARTYLYMMPTFAFAPLEVKVQEDYRITPEIVETLRETLKLYVGCKNYHNFTSRKKPTDPSAKRFIMSFTSSDPFVKDGLEYVVLEVKGQSFMLHQIRKMIGLVVAIMRGCANVQTMDKCFTMERIDIPKAPGLGLMLGEAHYDHYNKKFGKDGMHEPLIWDNVAEKIEQFCQDQIYTVVTRTENEDKSMFQWLETVPFHSYDIRDDKPKGYSAIGAAQMNVKRVNGEDVDDDLDEDELDSDDELPKKKLKIDN